MTNKPGVAIVHYHLRTGGVTRVIQHIVSSVQDHGFRCVVLSGEEAPPSIASQAEVRVIPDLSYRKAASPGLADRLLAELKEEAAAALGARPDVWHFHNHSLGKNPAVPLAVHALAQEGRPLLLQIHDFAEDARPRNYARLVDQVGGGDHSALYKYLYPAANHVHYAVLNGRDQEFLASAGAAPSNVNLLPNAVTMGEPPEASDSGPTEEPHRFIYPTRAIRRKNLGEFLLWAALDNGGGSYEITRAPRNPAERTRYERWIDFSEYPNLPAHFEVGEKADCAFLELLRTAHVLVTTSVAEGFGMCFLEPWLVGRPLAGRDLPEITRDFRSEGVDLSRLYGRLEVPVDWLDSENVREKLKTGLENYRKHYGMSTTETHVQLAWQAFVTEGRVDVGRLDESLQEHLIRRVTKDQGARRSVRPSRLDGSRTKRETIRNNQQAVQRSFSLQAYGEKLADVYRQVADSASEQPEALSGSVILEEFLDPTRFSLLRTG